MIKREDRKKQITGQRREQILSAGLNIFSCLGFDRATIPDIATEAGISVGTIYNYFNNKRDLLVAIINKYVIEPFADFVERLSTDADPAVVMSIMEDRINFGLDNVNRFLPLFNEVQRDDELRHRYNENVLRPIMATMERFVTTRMEAGIFRDINPAILTRAVGGMIIGFMILYRIEAEGSPIQNMNRQNLVNELAGLILRGLQK